MDQIHKIPKSAETPTTNNKWITGSDEKDKATQLFQLLQEICKTEDTGQSKPKIIIAGGRGLKKEGFLLLEKLAGRIGGEIGCTRPCVDLGWTREDLLIGQTGATINPDLYLAFGISGAIQHITGITDSACIVGINTNPRAAIFRYCNYGVEGDAVKILEYLLEKLDAPEKCD